MILIKKTLSAIVLILIAIPLILAGEKTFALTIGIVGVFALKEFLDLKKSHHKVPFFMNAIFYVSLLFIIFVSPFEFSNLVSVDYRFLSFMFLLYCLPVLYYHSNGIYKTSDALYFLGVTLFLGVACHSLIMLRIRSLELFLFVVSIPILTDTFAYIFGKLIGKHSLTKISPNKTWEGSICGSLCATIVSSGIYFIWFSESFWKVVSFVFLLTIVSQLGDLFFSVIKRENDIKDFANLIPEHGGILDRFDSIIFVAIAVLLFIPYL